MGKFYLANNISATSTNANQYGSLTIPVAYKNTTITVSWYTRGYNASSASGYTVSSFLNLSYKLDSGSEQIIQSQSRSAHTTGNLVEQTGTASIVIGNNTTLKFRFNYGRTIAGGGGASFSPSFTWTCYVKCPFGGITSEDIITAAKLNAVATANGVNTSVTAGNNIIRTPWQTIGTAVGVTFDSTNPLKTNLEAVLYETPGSFDATGSNVGW